MENPRIGQLVTIPWRSGRIHGTVIFVNERRRVCKVRVPRNTILTTVVTIDFDEVWETAMKNPKVGDQITIPWEGEWIHGEVVWIKPTLLRAGVEFECNGSVTTRGFEWRLIRHAEPDSAVPA